MKKLLLTTALTIVALGEARAQDTTWNYDFGTNSGTWTTGASTNTFLPAPAAGGGTNYVRVGTGAGSFTLTNTGGGSQLVGVAASGSSVNKFSIYNFSNPTDRFAISFDVSFTGGASGSWSFYTGNGSSFDSSGSDFSSAQTFTGLRFQYGASNAISVSNRAGGSWAGVGGTGIAQNTTYSISIFGNNSASSIDYLNSGTNSLAANTYDLWVDGVKVAAALAKSSLPSLSLIDSFMFVGASSTANVATLTLDNISYANFLQSPAPPSLVTWTGTGSGGTWQVGQQGNFASPYTNSATIGVEFAGTGEAVGVVGNVEAGSLTFASSGYALSGGTISNVAGTVSIASGSASIDSSIAGASGLTKAGAGSLSLGGSNTFTGTVSVSGGSLQITNDAALGNAANDLVNNGTLKTTTSVALDVGRDISGSGTYDIANGTTLTVNGGINNTATTLANTGTLDVQGGTRALGSLTLNAAGTISGSGAISVTGLTAPGVSSGTATVNPDIIFTTTGDKTLNVAAGGAVDLNGALTNSASTTSRIAKTGTGTLILSAANNMGGVRVGAAGAAPTEGGTVVLENSAIGTQAQAIQLNYGTLSAASNLTFTNGLSIGGRTGAVAVLSGNSMEFQGSSSFFRANGTSGELLLDINNTTTFSGGFGATTSSGTGSSTGVTFGGTGTLIIGGNGASFTDALTFGSGLTAVRLTSSNALAGATIVGGAEKLEFATTSVDVVGITGSQNLNLQTADPTPQAVALTMNTAGVVTNSGVISGLGSFNKAGAGTVVFAGGNTYTGTTTVSAGSLFINGSQSAANGVLTVASGATLGGSGAMGGAVNVAGTLAPGNSIESLSMGALSFSNGSTFAVELDSSVATSVGADLAVASGGLSLDGTVTLTLNDIALAPAAFSVGTKFSLINYSGSWNNGLFTFGAGTLADGDVFTFGANNWEIDYNSTVGGVNFTADYLPLSNFVNIEVIPEPSTYALLTLAAAGLGAHLIRRRRR